MTRIKLVGLALVAMSVISASTAAGAEASTFLLLGTTKAKILAKAKESQRFVTKVGTIECATVSASGEVTLKHSLTLEATITYSGCKAFGLAMTFSPALYEFNADGSVKLLKTITGKAVGCLITIPGGQTLSTVKYSNIGLSDIELKPSITGIISSGTGAACEYAEENKGTYVGAVLVTADGGEIEWTA